MTLYSNRRKKLTNSGAKGRRKTPFLWVIVEDRGGREKLDIAPAIVVKQCPLMKRVIAVKNCLTAMVPGKYLLDTC